MSEELSSESTPTICLVVPRLYNIINSLTGIRVKDPNPSSKAFATILLKNLEARFPNCGSQNYFYAAANILHPYYQGVVLFDLNTRESTMNTFLKENEVSDDLNSAIAVEDFEEEDMSVEALTQRARA